MNEKTDKIIFTFSVLWKGWECDSTAWVMEKSDGSRYLLMTNHGSEQVRNVESLYFKLKEYERVVSDTNTAIALLTREDHKA